jgi:hypothetical protein
LFIAIHFDSNIRNIEILPKSSKSLLFPGDLFKKVHACLTAYPGTAIYESHGRQELPACPASDGNYHELKLATKHERQRA